MAYLVAFLFAGVKIFLIDIGIMEEVRHPILMSIASEYVADANRYGHNISEEEIRHIDFTYIPKEIAGMGGRGIVLISTSPKYVGMKLKELVYHELTHAIFSCGHLDKRGSIMHSKDWLSRKDSFSIKVFKLFNNDIQEMKCTK